mmetsp:Transcript_19902/g.37433  ORF Transcript_19902/g.37433 Transcript_19902/m.37433 type:complete len:862 (-) Transcript_19902:60-2645(-)
MASYVKNSLFIRNLSPNVTEKALRELFTPIDAIERISFRAFPNQNHQFFAQIDFKSSKGVTDGTKLNGTKIMGVECLIGVIDPVTSKLQLQLENEAASAKIGGAPSTSTMVGDIEQPQGVQAEYFKRQKEAREDTIFRTAHMTGFQKGVTEEVLLKFCSHFGEVLNLRIEEPEQGDPFAIIEFKEKGAAHVVKTQREYLVDGRILKFSESKTMVDDVSFTEQAVHFQAPVFDTLNMRAVLAQQGQLNAKLSKVREAAMSIFTEPSKDDEAAKSDSAAPAPEDKSEDQIERRQASESREKKPADTREHSQEKRHRDKKKKKKEKETGKEKEKRDVDTPAKEEFNISGKWVMRDSKSGDKFKYYWTQTARDSFTGEQRGAGAITWGKIDGDLVSWQVADIRCTGVLTSASKLVDGSYFNDKTGKILGTFTGECQDAEKRQRQQRRIHRDRRKEAEASRSRSESRVKRRRERSKQADRGRSASAPEEKAETPPKKVRRKTEKKKKPTIAAAQEEDSEEEEARRKAAAAAAEAASKEEEARRKDEKAAVAAAEEKEDESEEDSEDEKARRKAKKKAKKEAKRKAKEEAAKVAEAEEEHSKEDDKDKEEATADQKLRTPEAPPGLSRLELLRASKPDSEDEESEEDSESSMIDVEEHVEVVANTEYVVMGATSSSSSGSSRSPSPVRERAPKPDDAVEFVANPWAQGPDAIEMDVLKSATVELDATLQVDCEGDGDPGEQADISSSEESSSSSSSSEDSPVRELAGDISEGEKSGAVLSDGEDDVEIEKMELDVELHSKAKAAGHARRRKAPPNGQRMPGNKGAVPTRRKKATIDLGTIDLGLVGGTPRRRKGAVNGNGAAGLVLD